MDEQAFVYMLPQAAEPDGSGALRLSWPAGAAPFGASAPTLGPRYALRNGANPHHVVSPAAVT